MQESRRQPMKGLHPMTKGRDHTGISTMRTIEGAVIDDNYHACRKSKCPAI